MEKDEEEFWGPQKFLAAEKDTLSGDFENPAATFLQGERPSEGRNTLRTPRVNIQEKRPVESPQGAQRPIMETHCFF